MTDTAKDGTDPPAEPTASEHRSEERARSAASAEASKANTADDQAAAADAVVAANAGIAADAVVADSGAAPSGVASSGTAPAGRRRIRLLAAVAALVLVADVVSKIIVVATLSDRPPAKLLGGLVYLVEARNAGAAFSFAQGATVLFTAIAALVIGVILHSASQLRSLPWAVCLGLILGGAAGNLTDRLFRSPGPGRGRVVDWISVLDPAGRIWPVFNLADSAIVVGGVLAVLLAFSGYELSGARTRRRSR